MEDSIAIVTVHYRLINIAYQTHKTKHFNSYIMLLSAILF